MDHGTVLCPVILELTRSSQYRGSSVHCDDSGFRILLAYQDVRNDNYIAIDACFYPIP